MVHIYPPEPLSHLVSATNTRPKRTHRCDLAFCAFICKKNETCLINTVSEKAVASVLVAQF